MLQTPFYFRLDIREADEQYGVSDKDVPVVCRFAVRSYEGRQYLYNVTRPLDVIVEWVKSIGIFLGNIFHNIFVKCINVLGIKLLSACGVPFKKDVMDKANRMWSCGTPWKALIALVVQIFLNILSIITLGLFTTELNRLSGYVEMKTLGDENSAYSLERRQKEKDYFAPCQQPFALIQSSSLQSSTSQDPINLFSLISSDQKRKVARQLDNFKNQKSKEEFQYK